MIVSRLISEFSMQENSFISRLIPGGAKSISCYLCNGLTWESIYEQLVPFMLSDDFEPLDWYFVEEKPGGWKNTFGLVFWSRGAWINRKECALVTRYADSLSVRTFSSQTELDLEVQAMRAFVERQQSMKV